MISIHCFALFLTLALGFTQCNSRITENSAENGEKSCSEREKTQLAEDINQIVKCLERNVFSKFNLSTDMNRCCEKTTEDSTPEKFIEKWGNCLEVTYNQSLIDCTFYDWDIKRFYECYFDEDLSKESQEEDFSCLMDMNENGPETKSECPTWTGKIKDCFRDTCFKIVEIYGDQKLSEEYRLKDVLNPVCKFLADK